MKESPDSPNRTGMGVGAPAARRRLRVAYIMSRFPKISETFVLYEILALESQGIAVEVFPLLRERQSVSHPEAAAVVARAYFHPFVSARILAAHGHYLLRRPRAYLAVLWEVLRGTWGSANFFAGALGIFPKSVRFAYEMQALGVEHVHAHFATHPAVAALIVHRLTGIPFSFTAHGSDLHVDRRMLDRKVEAAAFAVTISEFNKEVMVAACGEALRAKIHVVHCGVDPQVFTPVRSVRPAPLHILCVASLEEVKGHATLLEACQLLRQRDVRFRCDLVGEGPLRAVLQQQIQRHGLSAHVHLHVTLHRPEVSRLMAAADIICLPSVPTRQGKREGIPVVLLEAMASGVPVVSSRLSGIPELVLDGKTGILVEPRHSEALAAALQQLGQEPLLRRRLGAAGRARVEMHFDLHANARRLGELFSQSLGPAILPAVQPEPAQSRSA